MDPDSHFSTLKKMTQTNKWLNDTDFAYDMQKKSTLTKSSEHYFRSRLQSEAKVQIKTFSVLDCCMIK